MSCLDMLDMSENMSGHVRTRWTQVPCMRKYALETSPGADCENMRSAKIILSPYDGARGRVADFSRFGAHLGA